MKRLIIVFLIIYLIILSHIFPSDYLAPPHSKDSKLPIVITSDDNIERIGKEISDIIEVLWRKRIEDTDHAVEGIKNSAEYKNLSESNNAIEMYIKALDMQSKLYNNAGNYSPCMYFSPKDEVFIGDAAYGFGSTFYLTENRIKYIVGLYKDKILIRERMVQINNEVLQDVAKKLIDILEKELKISPIMEVLKGVQKGLSVDLGGSNIALTTMWNYWKNTAKDVVTEWIESDFIEHINKKDATIFVETLCSNIGGIVDSFPDQFGAYRGRRDHDYFYYIGMIKISIALGKKYPSLNKSVDEILLTWFNNHPIMFELLYRTGGWWRRKIIRVLPVCVAKAIIWNKLNKVRFDKKSYGKAVTKAIVSLTEAGEKKWLKSQLNNQILHPIAKRAISRKITPSSKIKELNLPALRTLNYSS